MEDNKLKNRLVGFIALIVLGVVFFPLFLDMNPAPGTRLEDAKIPPRPEVVFFPNEKDEQKHSTAQTVTSQTPSVITTVLPTPPVINNESKVALEQTPVVTEQPQPVVDSSVPPQQLPPPKANVYTTEIKPGASLNGVFAKAGLGNNQVLALLKLGKSLNGLDNLQSGRKILIKSNSQNELQQLIYYGPGNKIYSHVIRRGGSLQLADTNSAIKSLTNKDNEKNSITNTAAEKDKNKNALQAKAIPPAKPMQQQLSSATTKPKTNVTPAVNRTPPPNKTNNANANNSWVVQIASLNRKENAKALHDSLKSKGFPVFLEPLYEGNNKKWRVRVGPTTDRNEVNNLKNRLERDVHLNDGKVLPYP